MNTSRSIRYGLLVTAGVALIVASAVTSEFVVEMLFEAGSFVVYAYLGGLIIARRDGHITGWLLVMIGLLLVFIASSTYIAGAEAFFARWVSSWGWAAMFALFTFLTLTFPQGHTPRGPGAWARAARTVIWLLPVLVLAIAVTETLGGSEMLEETPNPFGFLPDWVSTVSLAAVVVVLLTSVVSLVLKRRRSTGAERAQLTWVVFGLVLLVLAILLTFLYITVSVAAGAGDPGDAAWSPAYLVMVSFPLTFGVAILRYRLYDIDRIISRTISYVVVVALLASVFFGVVTVVGSLVQTESDLAIAASTLAVAALFNPLRRRVQAAVDRRFNRSRYDAERVIGLFTGSLQGRADGEELVNGWISVVSETMQPSSVGVWVRQ